MISLVSISQVVSPTGSSPRYGSGYWAFNMMGKTLRKSYVSSDCDLFRLIFAATFTLLTPPIHVNGKATASSSTNICSLLFRRSIGKPWPSNCIVSNEDFLRIAELELELGADIRETSWLEYEVRMATSSFRDPDQYFEV